MTAPMNETGPGGGSREGMLGLVTLTMPSCTVAGCDHQVRVKMRGLCNLHYRRWQRYGDTSVTKRPLRVGGEEVDRFWAKVQFTDGHWLWIGAADRHGYGDFRGKRQRYAHRWAYEFCVAPIPGGLVIDHLCHTPACVRPDHLEAVSQAVNMARSSAVLRAHCKHGHLRTPENTYRNPSDGSRSCRTCIQNRGRK